MKLLILAWRNVFRQKRRTFITLSALIIGLAGLVVFQGFIAQTMTGFRNRIISHGLGHLQVAKNEEYFMDGEFNPYAYALPDARRVWDEIEHRPEVAFAFPSTGFTAIAGFGEKSTALLVKAYPAANMFFTPPDGGEAPAGCLELGHLCSGTGLTRSTPDTRRSGVENGEPELILGATAARILKVKAGDCVTLMAILPQGGLNGKDFLIKGIYSAAGWDKVFAFTDFETAKEFTFLTSAPVIHVFLKKIAQTDAVARTLAPDLSVRTWKQMAAYFMQVNAMFRGFLKVIQFIILLITLFILANMMNRIVFERMREWGALRTMGTKQHELVLLLVFEGGFQGLLGGVAGIIVGLAVSGIINGFGGIPFTNEGTLYHVKLVAEIPTLLFNIVPVIITAMLAALFPALRAARMTPAECLRQF